MDMKEHKDVWNALVMVFQFGINMIVPILMCTLFGVWIGEKYDIKWIGNKTGAAWVTVPLFFVGALAGGTNIYKMSKKLIESDSKGKTDRNVKKTK